MAPKVVILGSGYAGAQCARSLQSKIGDKVDLTVVEKRTHNVHKVPILLGNWYNLGIILCFSALDCCFESSDSWNQF